MRVARLLLTAALLSAHCSHEPREVMMAKDRVDAAADAQTDASAPFKEPETPGPCDQPDGTCRIPCNFEKSPMCPGTQVCVIGCENGLVAQYCREPDLSALALGEMCSPSRLNCRVGGCMQEPRGSDGPHCTALCVIDQDCPADTHCVDSSFSFGCAAGRELFKAGLCRSLAVVGTPP